MRRWLLTLLNFCTSFPKLEVLSHLSYVRLSKMFRRIQRDIVVTHALSPGLELVPQIMYAYDNGRDKHRPISVAPILEDQWNLIEV